jgi:hypothetical protein
VLVALSSDQIQVLSCEGQVINSQIIDRCLHAILTTVHKEKNSRLPLLLITSTRSWKRLGARQLPPRQDEREADGDWSEPDSLQQPAGSGGVLII